MRKGGAWFDSVAGVTCARIAPARQPNALRETAPHETTSRSLQRQTWSGIVSSIINQQKRRWPRYVSVTCTAPAAAIPCDTDQQSKKRSPDSSSIPLDADRAPPKVCDMVECTDAVHRTNVLSEMSTVESIK
eukprot:198475-Prymnesium_polylepis.1